jgi:hypothetical protein
MSDWNAFITKYNGTTDEIRALVDSGKLTPLAEELSKSTSKKVSECIILLSDYLLEVIDQSALKSALGLSDVEFPFILQKFNMLKSGKENLPNIPEANKDIREKLELRPESAMPKPLTREDVMSAISPKRTMASDIASLKKSNPPQQ